MKISQTKEEIGRYELCEMISGYTGIIIENKQRDVEHILRIQKQSQLWIEYNYSYDVELASNQFF